jgi:hypothetical protein
VRLTNTSILRTGLSTRYWRPFGWLRASRLLPPRSGLERSDFVLWPATSLTATQQYTCSWGDIRHCATNRARSGLPEPAHDRIAFRSGVPPEARLPCPLWADTVKRCKRIRLRRGDGPSPCENLTVPTGQALRSPPERSLITADRSGVAYRQRLRFVVGSARGVYVCTWWQRTSDGSAGLRVLTHH